MIQEPVDVLRAWGHVLVWDPRWAGAPGVSALAKTHLLKKQGRAAYIWQLFSSLFWGQRPPLDCIIEAADSGKTLRFG